MKIWTCKIGEIEEAALHEMTPHGADKPMRDAVKAAYRMVAGHECDFIFSGWGGRLDEIERAVVEDREPEYVKTDHALMAGSMRARALLQQLSEHPEVALKELRFDVRALEAELRSITAAHPITLDEDEEPMYVPTIEREDELIGAIELLIEAGRPHCAEAHNHLTEFGAALKVAQTLVNRVKAQRAGIEPCGVCGYRYDCGEPAGSECHS